MAVMMKLTLHVFVLTEKGRFNSNRTESETCQQFQAELNQQFRLESYRENANNPVSRTCCVDITGAIDCACKCKKMKDKKFNRNACMKAPSIPNALGDISKRNSVIGALDTFNELTGSRASK